jgi:hypothetical protein
MSVLLKLLAPLGAQTDPRNALVCTYVEIDRKVTLFLSKPDIKPWCFRSHQTLTWDRLSIEDGMLRISSSSRLYGRRHLALLCLAAIGLTGTSAGAQTTTPPQPAAAQPTIPQPIDARKPDSPVVESLVDPMSRRPLEVHKHPRHIAARHRHYAHRFHTPIDLDRPALAGVEVLQPLPRPGQPPHLAVPLPAYPLDEIATALTMPPPPIVCHPIRREPGLPDPHLYRERTVACEPDNP